MKKTNGNSSVNSSGSKCLKNKLSYRQFQKEIEPKEFVQLSMFNEELLNEIEAYQNFRQSLTLVAHELDENLISSRIDDLKPGKAIVSKKKSARKTA